MSLRDQMVALLVAQPGMTAAELREAMQAMGLNIGRGEPAITLRILREQGRVRYEGEMPGRRYFAVEGAAAPAIGGRRKKGPDEIGAHSPTAIPKAKPAVDALASAADIEQRRVTGAVLDHVKAAAGWLNAEQMAADLGEERRPVALAIAELMRAGRLTRRAGTDGRWEYGDKLEPVAEVAAPAAEADPPAVTVPSAGPEAKQFISLDRVAELLNQPFPLNELPKAIDLELIAIEDILGNACDAQAPHSAIKALVAASSSLRRAQRALAA